MQLWDTAGQERFRSLTRGYYRGSAGVLLVYDISSRASFAALSDFIADVRALTSPSVSIVVLGNKSDLMDTTDPTSIVPESEVADFCMDHSNSGTGTSASYSKNSHHNANSNTFLGNDISFLTTSALTGENIDEAFQLLAGMILTKIEMGVIDPENMDFGVQYGDVPRWDRNSTRRGGNLYSSGSPTKSKAAKKTHGRSLTTLVAGSGHFGAGGDEYQHSLQRNKVILGGKSSKNNGKSQLPSASVSLSESLSTTLPANRCC